MVEICANEEKSNKLDMLHDVDTMVEQLNNEEDVDVDNDHVTCFRNKSKKVTSQEVSH
jgi:hypothetical protein